MKKGEKRQNKVIFPLFSKGVRGFLLVFTQSLRVGMQSVRSAYTIERDAELQSLLSGRSMGMRK